MKGGCRFENTGTPFRFRGSNFFPYVKEHKNTYVKNT